MGCDAGETPAGGSDSSGGVETSSGTTSRSTTSSGDASTSSTSGTSSGSGSGDTTDTTDTTESTDTGDSANTGDREVIPGPCQPWTSVLPGLTDARGVSVDATGRVVLGGGDGTQAWVLGLDEGGEEAWAFEFDAAAHGLPEADESVLAVEPLPGGTLALLIRRDAGAFLSGDFSAAAAFDPSAQSIEWVTPLDLSAFLDPLDPKFDPIMLAVPHLATSPGGLLSLTGYVGWYGGGLAQGVMFRLDPSTGETLVSAALPGSPYPTLDLNVDDTLGTMITYGGSGVAADFASFVRRFADDGEFVGGFGVEPEDAPQRIGGVGVASDGTIILAAAGFPGQDAKVERRTLDGTVLGSASMTFEDIPAGRRLVVSEDDNAYEIARFTPTWVLRATPDDTLSLLLSPEDGEDLQLEDIATGPLGRVVVVGTYTDPLSEETVGYARQFCE